MDKKIFACRVQHTIVVEAVVYISASDVNDATDSALAFASDNWLKIHNERKSAVGSSFSAYVGDANEIVGACGVVVDMKV